MEHKHPKHTRVLYINRCVCVCVLCANDTDSKYGDHMAITLRGRVHSKQLIELFSYRAPTACNRVLHSEVTADTSAAT